MPATTTSTISPTILIWGFIILLIIVTVLPTSYSDEPDLNVIDRVLSNPDTLRAWPLLSPVFITYVEVSNWLLADAATVHPGNWNKDWDAERPPVWDPSHTALVMSALVRCGILFSPIYCLYRLRHRLFKSVTAVGLAISDSLATATSVHIEWEAFLDACTAGFISLIGGCVRAIGLLVLITLHKLTCGVVSWHAKLRGIRNIQMEPIKARTVDSGTSIGTVTPPFWDGLCLNETAICRSIRDELSWVKETKRTELNQQRKEYDDELRKVYIRNKETHSDYKKQIAAQKAELQKLDANASASDTIASLENELAAKDKVIDGFKAKLAELGSMNQRLCTRLDRCDKQYEAKLRELSKNPPPASEVLVTKWEYDQLKIQRDRYAERWASQFTKFTEVSKANAALQNKLEWLIKYKVPSQPSLR